MTETVSNKISNLGLVCACLVVLIHTPIARDGANSITYWIKDCLAHSCAVPLFFAISGYLLSRHIDEDGWWMSSVRKRVLTLVVPYFIINFGWFFVKFGIHAIGVGLGRATGGTDGCGLESFLIGLGVWPGAGPVVEPLWYVRALFLFVLASPGVAFFIKKGRIPSVGLLICLFFLWLLQPIYRCHLDLSNNILRYDLNMRNLFCFTMGMTFCKFTLPQMSRGKEIATAILAGCVFVAAVFMKNLGWPWSELMFIIRVLAGSLMLWMIISSGKWPLWLLGCAFPLYAFHTIVIDLIGAPLKAFGVYSQVVKGLGLFGFAGIVIVITIMGTRLLKKHCPKTAAVIFGGR